MAELRSSYSFTPSWPQHDAAREEPWFAPEWSMLPVASRQCRVRNPVNGAVVELTADRHAVLRACEGCHTLAEHAVLVRQRLNVREDDAPTIAEWLKEFAARGLLMPLRELTGRLRADDPEPAPFAGVFVRTCDRPALLDRALAGAAALAARYGRGNRYIVLDDSRGQDLRAANRRIVNSTPLACTYIDLAVTTDLERELRRRFAEAGDVIDWLFGDPAPGEMTYGRPVNAALLLTAGRRMLMLDDDALLDPRSPPIQRAGFLVSSAHDELFCYPSAAVLYAECPLLELDPIAAHLDVLGRSIGSLWERFSKAGSGEPAVDLDAHDATRFSPRARALFTQNHALGDPGSSLFPYHLLSLPAASKARLFRDPHWRAYAFTERINWRGQPQPRLATKRPFTLTTLAGFDNSVLLPPTTRAHRNEDLLLGQMAQHIHTGGWFVDLPWGLSHWRDPAKKWIDPGTSFRQEPIHFLMDHLAHRAPVIESDAPEGRLRALAALLLDLSIAGERHLTELLTEQVADTATRTLFSIAEQLDDPALPPAWEDMLRPWLTSPALSTEPVALEARIASTTTVRTLAANYGRALLVWPELWNAARELQGNTCASA